MADGEHRMVFDIRGKRRHVVKVVYAILAVLMGLSLFLVTGAVNLNSLFGGSTSSGPTAKPFEEQQERIERKLAKSPEDPDLLIGLTRAQINAANVLSEVNPETGEAVPTPAGTAQLEGASESWSKYLKATDEPSTGAAQLVAPALFSLARYSTTGASFEANMKAAVQAQEVISDQRPTLNSLSQLAIYKYFTFDYAGAKKAGDEALKLMDSRFERESLENQLKTYEKNAHIVQGQIKEVEKAQKGAGKEALENPFGGLGGGSSLSE